MGLEVEFSTIIEMFDRVTQQFVHEKRPMLMHKVEGKYRGISYVEMRAWVEMFAHGLAALGVQRGDRLAVISENRPEWVVADMGMMLLGAANVSIFPTLAPKQIEFILNDSAAKIVIVSNQFQLNKVKKIAGDVPSLKNIIVMDEKVQVEDERTLTFSKVTAIGKEQASQQPDVFREAITKTKPDDLLTLIYTSGTTGNPKGVMLTHKNLVSNMKASIECIPFVREDTLLSFLPLSHSYERMAGYYTAMSSGATIAYAESIETVRENLLEVQPTVVTTVPRLFERMYNRMMKQIGSAPPLRQKIFHWAVGVGRRFAKARKRRTTPFFLRLQHRLADKLVFSKIKERTGGRMKYFVSGGAALSRELGEFFDAVGIQILEGYGMTESSPVISVNRLDDYKFGTVGKPIPGVEVRIAEDGEILARGPNVMKGYWNNQQATDEIIDKEGWLHTGDIGMFDHDGFLVITDRKKHLFVSSGGKNIAPQPIENLFLQCKYIDQFVLIGDGRMYCTALIVPDFDMLKEYAESEHISYNGSEEQLLSMPEINKFFEEEIGRIQKDLSQYERVRKFTLLGKPLTIENGEITPTLKVRRKVVEEKFKSIIDKMYEGIR
ncbi:MAG: long-chain fatty acid--CoA ligase [Ignavibacteriae bacterium]|nr:long-chain fatty acid--CoA ligase [Ignavibacteriota bacterium]